MRRWINGKDPRQYGFDFGLWTRKAVGDLMARKFGVRLSLASTGYLLARLGLTLQKPLQRAYERDPEAIAAWKNEVYPKLAVRAKRRGAEIYFWDESGFRADAVQGRTWGSQGPDAGDCGAGDTSIGVGGIGGRCQGGVLPAHKAKVVRDYAESTGGKLEFHFLPGYAPDLNPDELVWNYMKRTGTARRALVKGETLQDCTETDLFAIQPNPAMVRSFFRAKNVAYITD